MPRTMRLPRSGPLAASALLAALLAAAPGPPAAAQDAPPKDAPELDDEPPKPLTPEEQKAAQALFAEAKALSRKGWQYGMAASKKYEEFMDKYPGADEEMLREADDRSGPNCLIGIELQHDGGPPERRIDVELMGDGYTKELFKKFKGHAFDQMKAFWADPLFGEYADYFNIWRFDLVSAEEGVDQMTPEERGAPPPPDPKPGKPKKKKKQRGPKKYSTALNCMEMGGGGQVYADREQVMRWRRYLECSDGLTIAFAKKGRLGMGGGGIATTGPMVAVVHEFGHAWAGLLDEYQGNPDRPTGRVVAPNAISTENPDPREPPPLDEIPWKHWMMLKPRPTDVGVELGGATYSTGVFRPAKTCAMNSAGSAFLCTVCREQGVLRIYSYVSPVDEAGPIHERVEVLQGEAREFFVQPMAPKSHRIQVDWTLQVIGTSPDQAPPVEAPSEGSYVADERAAAMWQGEGPRAATRRDSPLPEGNPKGAPLKPTLKKAGAAFRSSVTLDNKHPGVYRLTARVFDDTKIGGGPHPWVIKDPDRLREEWKTWTIVVAAPAAAAPPAPPSPGGGK